MLGEISRFVGVVGIMKQEDILQLLSVVPEEPTHLLAAIVRMNSKTLRGEEMPGRIPRKERVEEIFSDDLRVLNLIEFCPDHDATLFADLEDITTFVAGPLLDGFVFKGWPSISSLEIYRSFYPHGCLVLRIGKEEMRQIESVKCFEKLISEYAPILDSVVISSANNKTEETPEETAKREEYFRVLQEFPNLGFGIAGHNLSPEKICPPASVIFEFPRVDSIVPYCEEDKRGSTYARLYLQEIYNILEKKRSKIGKS